MEWRCEWCGKPHEEDDPPCDNCGHDSFERAVVQGTDIESTAVWVCTECGREHAKHAPPCSRCGNPTLDRREITVDDDELAAPRYRDLLTPRYVIGLAAVAVLGLVLLLGLAGVVDLPGLKSGVPSVADVPGNATHLDGTSLAAVEAAFLERANTLRPDADLASLEGDDRLGNVATYYNQRRVKAALGDGSVPGTEDVRELLPGRCGDRASLVTDTVAIPADAGPAGAIGERLADRAFETGQLGFPAPRGLSGLDTHALPNRSLSVTQLAC